MRELDSLVEELRKHGFELIISHPDRTWRVHIWATKQLPSPPFEVSIALLTKRDVLSFLKAVLLGFNTGKIS